MKTKQGKLDEALTARYCQRGVLMAIKLQAANTNVRCLKTLASFHS